MRRTELAGCLLLATFLGLLPAATAEGHGDQFRDPDPSQPPPPWLRPPETPDPTRPPPPWPAPPEGTLPPPPSGRFLPERDWFFWWQMNSAGFENLKWALYHSLGGRMPLFTTERRTGPRFPSMRLVAKGVEEVALPALLEVLEGDEKDAHVRAAALLALGKLARTPGHVELLLRSVQTVEGDRVGEAAALALGLLRREDPTDQHAAEVLAECRSALFQAIEAPPKRVSLRVRGAAALALGLLGDQPVVGEDEAAVRRAYTARLFAAFRASLGDAERASPLALALGHQVPASITGKQRKYLAYVLRLTRVDESTRAWVASALGRIGDDSSLFALTTSLGPARGEDRDPTRAAVAAIACLARSGRLDARQRSLAVVTLRQVSGERPRRLSRGLALLGLGRLGAKRAHLLARLRARDDQETDRAFAALAVGLAARRISDGDGGADQAWRAEALAELRGLLAGDGTSLPRLQAAACIAVGLARDMGAHEALLGRMRVRDPYEQLAGAAAWGLGLVGSPTVENTRALARGARGAQPELRRRSVRALALLGGPRIPGTGEDHVEILLADLERIRSVPDHVDVLVLLARFADQRAFDDLVRTLRNEDAPPLVRALAASGLGAIGDLEWLSALDRLRADAPWFALTDATRRAFRYL